MELPQRKTTVRIRSPVAFNDPVVEIRKEDVTGSIRIETPANSVLSALDEIKRLWEGGKVDYVAAAPVIDSHEGYFIYTPEKGVGSIDPSVLEHIDSLEETEKVDNARGLEGALEGVFIDTVRCSEDFYDLRIAKVVVRRP